MGEAKRIIKAAADMWGCVHETVIAGICGNCRSSEELVRRTIAVAEAMPFFTGISGSQNFGAGEDVSFMMERVQKNGGQATLIQIGADRAAGHHNNYFDFDDNILAHAVEFLARLTQTLLNNILP